MTNATPVRSPRKSSRRWAVAVFAGMAALAAVAGFATRNTATPPDSTTATPTDEVQAALRLGKPTVVEFGANACASCRAMKPVLEALERDHGDRIAVRNIDIVKTRGYASRYRIIMMPTQVYFDAQGSEIGRTMGQVSAGEILARLGVATGTRAR
ncbi:MAG: thioredoxin family protein [Burkholderiales bacterium]|nr:thioredoxin family protein [Burkholderiales bacterium]